MKKMEYTIRNLKHDYVVACSTLDSAIYFANHYVEFSGEPHYIINYDNKIVYLITEQHSFINPSEEEMNRYFK